MSDFMSYVQPLFRTLGWEKLKSNTSNTFIRSNYIWLAFVPAAAKVLQKLESPLEIGVGDASITLVLELPFSWQLFYWGAISFIVAHLIYLWRCPAYIRMFTDYQDYKRHGLYPAAIFNVYKKSGQRSERIDRLIDKVKNDVPLTSLQGNDEPHPELLQVEAEVFFYYCFRADSYHKFERFICTWALRVGYILFAIVFLRDIEQLL